jgi:hypothetical protein
MGGINPCDRPGHGAGIATGEHGEKLTESLFGSFSAFLQAHQSIERSIISGNQRNEVGAREHAMVAQREAARSLDLLQDVRKHLSAYSRYLESSDEFNDAVRRLNIDELGDSYVQAGIMPREGTLWNQVGASATSGGMRSGFAFVEELVNNLENFTRDVVNQMKEVPSLAADLRLETSIRYNEFPFIEVNQRALTHWQRVISAYQYVCLISLETFALVNNSRRPIQGERGRSQ